MSALEEASTVSRALDACGRKLEGSAAAAQYYRRRRRVFCAALRDAVREGRLSANPLDAVTGRDWRPPEVHQAVDLRRVANPAHMRVLLKAIGSIGLSQGPRLVALYGCTYYGMLRPSEAVSLLADNCFLPERGWGRLVSHEVRSAAPTGGGIYRPSTLWQVLQKARVKAFTVAQVASPLARKPYDFRHAGASWRLNAGTPRPQVAEWAGHTVEVLYRIYAHCLEGDDERWNKRMEDALG
jgi:integrase